MTQGTKMPLEWHREYNRQYRQRPGVKERLAAKARERYAKRSERPKMRCRWLTQRAIIAGRLVRQPCEVCGNVTVDAHHDDYAKPMAVRWLCRLHHREHHAKAGT